MSSLSEEILALLEREEEGLTRADLVEALERPRTTIWDNLLPHLETGEVVRRPKRTGKRGRPKILFCLAEEGEE